MNHHVAIALSFTLPCLSTTVGALLIFFFKKESKKLNLLTINFASGIMFSASFWSLLVPSLEYSRVFWDSLAIIPVTLGFLLGALLMIVVDLLTKHILQCRKAPKNTRTYKIFTAITIHNIPEGLSVGFAIGSAIATNSAITGAFMFAVGIALQNLPEGLATALPIFSCIKNTKRAFLLAFLSGVVEPLFAIFGYLLATKISCLLPWLLSFSAGTMIYVIIDDLLPEVNFKKKSLYGAWAFIIGFVVMMILDICF